VPHDALIERVCGAGIRQQVHVAPNGSFSMELGSVTDSYLDASADSRPQGLGQGQRMPGQGISRFQLANCELRATVSGFHGDSVHLAEVTPTLNMIDVGEMVMSRTEKIKGGGTVNVAALNLPKDARKLYEKGVAAEKTGRLGDARQYFERAVQVYPKYTNAWFQLGSVYQNLAETESARTAYTRATAIDSKFLPPYLGLSLLAYQARDWSQVLALTNHVLELDPLRYGEVAGYIVDLDPLDYAEAYFYNSAANFNLNKIADAERSGLKAERLDVRPRFPQLHLLLAEIFARKKDYGTAILETKIYLEMMPNAKNAEEVRERLAQYEKLNNGG
jgi:tetratricopeptide (TPR) repeat protein